MVALKKQTVLVDHHFLRAGTGDWLPVFVHLSLGPASAAIMGNTLDSKLLGTSLCNTLADSSLSLPPLYCIHDEGKFQLLSFLSIYPHDQILGRQGGDIVGFTRVQLLGLLKYVEKWYTSVMIVALLGPGGCVLFFIAVWRSSDGSGWPL